jgi:hypothetical protein
MQYFPLHFGYKNTIEVFRLEIWAIPALVVLFKPTSLFGTYPIKFLSSPWSH